MAELCVLTLNMVSIVELIIFCIIDQVSLAMVLSSKLRLENLKGK